MFHRGSEHWGVGKPNRVVLILTLTPRPAVRGETRLPSLGTLWALPWHGWGHTLDDMADAETGAMSQPWAALRSLGLYKPKTRDWGWDWITVNTIRIANDDNGYEREDLVDYFLKDGWGFVDWSWVPRSLFGDVPDEGNAWEEFLVNTFDKWIYWTALANVVIVSVYLIVLAVVSGYCNWKSTHKTEKNVNEKKIKNKCNGDKYSGTNGHNGINGASGHDNINGENGHNGINGTNGHSNSNGANNTIGANGHNDKGKENDHVVISGSEYSPQSPAASNHTDCKIENRGSGIIKRGIARLVVTYATTLILFAYVLHQASNSGWASDLRSGKLYSPPFEDRMDLYQDEDLFDRTIEISVTPRKSDVLIGGTIVSPGYDTHFLNYHAGNVAWRELIKAAARSCKINSVGTHQDGLLSRSWSSKAFTSAIIDAIVWELVSVENRRFLLQDSNGMWTAMSWDDARNETRKALLRETNEMLSSLDDKLLLLIADARYGHLRNTVLAGLNGLSYLLGWRTMMYSVLGDHMEDPPQWTRKAIGDGLAPVAVGLRPRDSRSLYFSAIPSVKFDLLHAKDAPRPIGKPRIGDCQCPGEAKFCHKSSPPKRKRFYGGKFKRHEKIEFWEGGDSFRWALGIIIGKNPDRTYDVMALPGGQEDYGLPQTDVRKLDAFDMDLGDILSGQKRPVCPCNL
uniref:Uncharacterized protein n=2 Tax=Ditylum brightwellii TaxID=49249 RepID=A0A7S4QPX3_9STRA